MQGLSSRFPQRCSAGRESTSGGGCTVQKLQRRKRRRQVVNIYGWTNGTQKKCTDWGSRAHCIVTGVIQAANGFKIQKPKHKEVEKGKAWWWWWIKHRSPNVHPPPLIVFCLQIFSIPNPPPPNHLPIIYRQHLAWKQRLNFACVCFKQQKQERIS